MHLEGGLDPQPFSRAPWQPLHHKAAPAWRPPSPQSRMRAAESPFLSQQGGWKGQQPSQSGVGGLQGSGRVLALPRGKERAPFRVFFWRVPWKGLSGAVAGGRRGLPRGSHCCLWEPSHSHGPSSKGHWQPWEPPGQGAAKCRHHPARA